MSADPSTEPGAPAAAAPSSTNIPAADEKSVAGEAQKRLPSRLLALAATPDRILLRLNKLLAAPGGLASFLSTLNYTLYLLAYAGAKTAPLRSRLLQLLPLPSSSSTTAGAALPPSSPAGPSHVAALGALLSTTRTTLRLFGLFPLYAWLRQLLTAGPKPDEDPVLYRTQLTQCLLYMAFQFLENVGVLTDAKVLPAGWTRRWTAAHGGTAKGILLWSYRAWLGGILCDFVRLFRVAQLERRKRGGVKGEVGTVREDEAEKADQAWWREMVVPLSWMPMAVHFALGEGGLPGWNLGAMGACGAMAGMGRISELWAKTA